jgi:hypothetical protein
MSILLVLVCVKFYFQNSVKMCNLFNSCSMFIRIEIHPLIGTWFMLFLCKPALIKIDKRHFN